MDFEKYDQTDRQTNKQTDRQAKFIYRCISFKLSSVTSSLENKIKNCTIVVFNVHWTKSHN